MNIAGRLGRYLMGFAVTAIGVESLVLGIPVRRLEPIPAAFPGITVIAYLSGAAFVAIGVGILIGKWARLAAAVLAIVLLAWVVLLYGPLLAARQEAAWLGTFETFACFSGAWMLAAFMPAESRLRGWNTLIERGTRLGRFGFGISLPVFGLAHFVYPEFVASWIPKWLPLPPLFWAYFTGVAHVAAGVGILTPVIPRLAALLAATMYGSWVLIVHIPRTLAAPHDAMEWNGIFVATMLCASALLAADAVTRAKYTNTPAVR